MTKAVRERWPHTPKLSGQPAAKGASDNDPGVQVYGPSFEIRVDMARTIHGVVNEAATGKPVPNAMVFTSSAGGYPGYATTDDLGHYRIVRQESLERLWLGGTASGRCPAARCGEGI